MEKKLKLKNNLFFSKDTDYVNYAGVHVCGNLCVQGLLNFEAFFIETK